MTMALEGFSVFKREQKLEDRSNEIMQKEKKISIRPNFGAISYVKETQPTEKDQCRLADGSHQI